MVRFVYSYPYEEALLELAKGKVLRNLHEKGYEKAKIAQEIWNKKRSYVNKLHARLQKENTLKNWGANLHYLIQAVEFAIVGEIFGLKYAEYSRDWVINNWKTNEYGKSAKLLKKHKVPLDKTCLEYIDKTLPNLSLRPAKRYNIVAYDKQASA